MHACSSVSQKLTCTNKPHQVEIDGQPLPKGSKLIWFDMTVAHGTSKLFLCWHHDLKCRGAQRAAGENKKEKGDEECVASQRDWLLVCCYMGKRWGALKPSLTQDCQHGWFSETLVESGILLRFSDIVFCLVFKVFIRSMFTQLRICFIWLWFSDMSVNSFLMFLYGCIYSKVYIPV